jgi:hypothetical protein
VLQRLRRLIVSIRENDAQLVEEAILQFSETRRIFAPLALAAGAIVMLFSGLRLLVTNWRLMLVQLVPATLIWAVTFDLKAHVLYGRQFNVIRGPVTVAVFAGVVLLTIASFFLNAVFAFTISRPGPPRLAIGFQEARRHPAVLYWGAGTGIALAVAAVLAPRWGLGWFTALLGIVLGFMLLCYVTVPAHIVGVQTAKAGKFTRPGRDKVAAAAITVTFGAIVCAPPYVITRSGLALLGTDGLFGLGVALLVVGLILEAGATGAVKAIKVSVKLLAHQPRHTPGDRPASIPGA